MKDLLLFILLVLPFFGNTQSKVLEPINVFDLEYAADPQISPDGQTIVYVRNFKDIMKDGNRSNLWMINSDGSNHRPLTTGMQNDRSPRWSPDGKKLIYLSAKEDKTQIYLRWMDNGMEARLTNLTDAPNTLTWSPDGKWLAFSMFVPSKGASLTTMPSKPKGAEWNAPPVYIDKLKFKADGQSTILPDGYQQVFIVSTEGGTPRQITTGDYNYNGISWRPDSKAIVVSTNQKDNWQAAPNDTEVYEINLADNQLKSLTDRRGPDNVVGYSPDGKWIAYTGLTDEYLGFQIQELYLMRADGTDSRSLTSKLDRSVGGVQWAADSRGLYFQYSDKGNSKVAYADLNGKVSKLADNLGGLSLGRPYSGGQFSVAKNGRFAFTHSTPDHPADVAVGSTGSSVKRLTRLNDDLFSFKELGAVEEIWYKSSYDGQAIQGWIAKPPGFDATKKYPLLLEIHGGPFADYGDRFSAEVQLYAAAGYVVLYTNPRGSSSYGKDFGNLIHHNYPNQDYDDLISGVDEVIAKGYIDENQLYVTGGSGGGVLTSWIIGKTDRFRAAVVAKPVINWYSFVLHADNPAFFAKYWFGGYPWEEGQTEKYMKRSPISLVGNVTTPTMLLTGEQDYRTPMSESEQYYTALKLQGVESALVRIQNSGHGIANTPSNLIAKVTYILAWFEKYKDSNSK